MSYDYEAKRLQVLRALELLDTEPEPEFDGIAAGAQHLFGSKIALVSLVDADRQWFKAKCGITADGTQRDVSFCSHAVAANDTLIVRDATKDTRFSDNPLVLGPPYIRMYVGVPLRAPDPDGNYVAIGTLCVIDDKPQDPTPDKIAHLQGMARVLGSLLDLRRTTRKSLELAMERNEAVMALDRARTQLLQAERMAKIGSWRLDLVTNELSWSDQVYAIHGLPKGDGTGLRTALDFYPPADRAQVVAALAACADHGKPYDLELDFVDARGARRRVRSMGEPELAEGRPGAIIGVFQDITDRHRSEQVLREWAHTDELTRLASRRSLHEHLDFLIDEALATGEALAVALLDMDHFKTVNDRFGHAVGDDVLRHAAATLLTAPYFHGHMAARLGGDEFVLVLRSRDAGPGLEEALNRLSRELRQQVGTGTDTVEVSVTIGVARLSPATCTRSAIMAAADAALYQAKQACRGTMKVAA